MDCAARKLYAAVAILALLLSPGCLGFHSRQQQPAELKEFKETVIAMDTLVTIALYVPSEEKAHKVFSEVRNELQRLEGILSAHQPGSDVIAISAAAGKEPVKVSPETLHVVQTALQYAHITQGAFDITVAPVLRLYNFDTNNPVRPSVRELERTLPLVDWRKVHVDEAQGTVFLSAEGMELDLGGVAKGYITDAAAEILLKNGVEFGSVNAGGDIRLLGPKPDGNPWRVGIKDPVNPGANNWFAIVEVRGGALVTSGDYERAFVEDGVRWHHIIDPASGLPASGASSVTVLAPTAEIADILSTALFVLGPEKGLELVESLPETEALIWARGEVFWSSGLIPQEGRGDVFYFTVKDK
ncbi:MAG TPA: FAD:protein FMN transferase [Bacillota bacterium]|nr:FAD:protein FMN transferase [Bacillota bacterium]